jgi:hypothetical protein
MPLNSCEFVEVGAVKTIGYAGGLSENFACIFYIFRPMWVKVGTRDVHRNISSFFSFGNPDALRAILSFGRYCICVLSAFVGIFGCISQ